MTYSALAHRFLQTVKQTGNPLTRSEIDAQIETIQEMGSELLEAATQLSQDGRPPFTGAEWSRAIVLRDWSMYRNGPASAFVDRAGRAVLCPRVAPIQPHPDRRTLSFTNHGGNP